MPPTKKSSHGQRRRYLATALKLRELMVAEERAAGTGYELLPEIREAVSRMQDELIDLDLERALTDIAEMRKGVKKQVRQEKAASKSFPSRSRVPGFCLTLAGA